MSKGNADLRPLFRRLLEGTSQPRVSTPEESERWRLAGQPATDARDVARQQGEIQVLLDVVERAFRTRTDALSERFARSEIAPGEFRAAMLTELRNALYSGAVIGAGGLKNLTAADVARVDRVVREQAVFLDRWMSQVEREPDKEHSVAKIQNRARQYGSTARVVAEETFDKNVMRAFPDYPDQLRPRTNTQCHGNCRCFIEWEMIDEQAGDANVWYRIRPGEHCQTCLLRSMAFSPLMIRGFEYINMPQDVSILIYNGVPQHFAPRNTRLVR